MDSEQQNKISLGFTIALTLLGIVISGFNTAVGIVIAMVGGLASILIFSVIQKSQNAKEQEKNIYFDKNTNILRLYHRNEKNRRFFSYERVVRLSYDYHPETTTFTAVNVGGVTTGGVDVREAYYSTGIAGTSDKYQIWYDVGKERTEKKIVDKILLTGEDVILVKRDKTLSQFLQDDKLILLHSVNSATLKTAANHLKETGDIYTSYNLASKDLADMNLTKEEAIAVIDFICGK